VTAADPAREFSAPSQPVKHHHVGTTASRGEVPPSGPDSADIGVKVESQGGSRLHWRNLLPD